LKQYFPQILSWFSDVDSTVVIDLLDRWPTLQELKRARRLTLDRFFGQHRCGGADNLEERWRQIQSAVPATTDEAVVKSCAVTARCLARLLREIQSSLGTYEQTIQELARRHPDFDLFSSFPGAGDALVPRLIAAFGTQRDRWANASELQCYSGIAPVLEASGRQQWIHVRWACPKFLRQTFHEWALHSIRKCSWAKEHYDAQIGRGKGRNAAIRSVAFKWLRIAFRCWKEHLPFYPDLYDQQRSKHPSTDLGSVGKLAIQWKTCGSFPAP
jgi:hypothetical protein